MRNGVLMGLVLLLSACQATAPCSSSVASSHSVIKLEYGVMSYEEGNYQASLIALRGVVDSGQSSNAERMRAYKYLAFIHCVSSQEKNCREFFRKALEINANFELDPAEAGHPVWGPVFRSVKSKFAK